MQFLALLSLAASVVAYQVTFPVQDTNWTQVGPNKLSWDRVSTDALNFTVILTNQDASVMGATNPLQLQALVDGTLGKISVNPPSTGFPIGTGFRLNLVKDTENLNTIFAQSDKFNIITPPASKSSSSSALAATTPAPAAEGANVASTTGSASVLSPTSSSTNAATGHVVGIPALGLAILGAVTCIF